MLNAERKFTALSKFKMQNLAAKMCKWSHWLWIYLWAQIVSKFFVLFTIKAIAHGAIDDVVIYGGLLIYLFLYIFISWTSPVCLDRSLWCLGWSDYWYLKLYFLLETHLKRFLFSAMSPFWRDSFSIFCGKLSVDSAASKPFTVSSSSPTWNERTLIKLLNILYWHYQFLDIESDIVIENENVGVHKIRYTATGSLYVICIKKKIKQNMVILDKCICICYKFFAFEILQPTSLFIPKKNLCIRPLCNVLNLWNYSIIFKIFKE